MLLNWDNHLVAWALDLEGTPFEWGAVDCLSTALTAASFINDNLAELDSWDDAESFRATVLAAGGPHTLLEAVASPVGLRRLQTGDLVYTPDADPDIGLGSISVVIRDRLLTVSVSHGARLVPLRFRPGAEGWRVDA